MPQVAAAAMIVGAGLQVVGDLVSAHDQAELDRERAKIALAQSDELGSREVANEAIRDQQATRQKLQFAASYAASGNAGSGVGSQLQIQNQADLQNMMSNRETQFQQKMLQEQAGIDTTLANQTEASGYLSALGAGLGGASKAMGVATAGGANPGFGGTASLGAYPSVYSPAPKPGQLGGGA